MMKNINPAINETTKLRTRIGQSEKKKIDHGIKYRQLVLKNKVQKMERFLCRENIGHKMERFLSHENIGQKMERFLFYVN